MRHQTKNIILLSVNIALWSLNYLSHSQTFSLFAKSGTPVSLEVDPPRFRLSVDGQPWNDNKSVNGWVNSPLILNMPKGIHKFTLERPGYTSHKFKLSIEESPVTPIKTALERQEAAKNMVEIMGVEIEDDDLRVSIDGGTDEGLLPLLLYDILPGEHVLEIEKTGFTSFRSKPITCTFIVLPDKILAKTKIVLSISGKKIITSQNCKRIKIAH